jgi:hypothetical protein
VAELALVPHIVPQVELVVAAPAVLAAARRHCYTHDDLLRLLFWFFPSRCFWASGSGGWVSSRNALASSYYLFLSGFSSYRNRTERVHVTFLNFHENPFFLSLNSKTEQNISLNF